jgi:predicted DNA-binding protein YlxM (UPF0122 family)
MITNDVKAVYWNGWVFRGRNTYLVMLDMYSRGGLSQPKIGKIFGISKQAVNIKFEHIKKQYPDLWDVALSKREFYEEFVDYYLETLNVIETAEHFEITDSIARRLVREHVPNVEQLEYKLHRNDALASILFGPKYKAGKNLIEYLKPFIRMLKYKNGRSIWKYIKNAGDYNFEDIQKLQLKIAESNPNIEDLIKEGVICRTRL